MHRVLTSFLPVRAYLRPGATVLTLEAARDYVAGQIQQDGNESASLSGDPSVLDVLWPNSDDEPEWDLDDLPQRRAAWHAEFNQVWAACVARLVTPPEGLGDIFK